MQDMDSISAIELLDETGALDEPWDRTKSRNAFVTSDLCLVSASEGSLGGLAIHFCLDSLPKMTSNR
jgi:hypothetical protein